MAKFIFVTGGVVSGLGKGITAASLGRLLKARGFKVAAQKLDPYINVDPGTMSPYQHGEVFVTNDGAETDLDLRTIDADPLPLTALAERLNAQDTFALAGQDYVRPKGDPGALLSPWYNKRVLDLSCVRAHDDLLFSPALTDELVRGFGFLLPYYDYLEGVTRREDA